MPGSDKRKITVKCSQCPRKYEANRAHYLKMKQLGKLNYCPVCVARVRGGNGKKSGETKRKNNLARISEFMAPCRLRIVPEREGPRARCNPALAGRCDEVETCLDFAARQDWPGWKVAR